jgi:acetate---CoA ligase (ADP-forming)
MRAGPRRREADVALRDGSTVHLRPATPGDAAAVEELLEGLSDRSRRLRFFSGCPNLEQAVRWATEVDDDHRYGLIATTDDGRVIGHAGFERRPDRPERAEAAMEVTDAMQGKGLSTILLGQLAAAAGEVGLQVLNAVVLPENHRMLQAFRDSGLPFTTRTLPGALLIELPTSPESNVGRPAARRVGQARRSTGPSRPTPISPTGRAATAQV